MQKLTLVLVAVCFIAVVSAFPAEQQEVELNPAAAVSLVEDEETVDGARAKRSPQFYGGYGGHRGGYGGYRGGYGGYGGYGGGYGGYRGGYGGYGGHRGGYGGGYGGYGGYGYGR